MGSFRSSPELTKHTYDMSSLDHSYAVTHMCGWRRYMEDASMIISPFTYRNFSLFGVFDGHGGPQVALFAQKHFPEELQKNQKFKAGKYEQALKQNFLKMDQMLLSQKGRIQIQQLRKSQIQKQNTSQQGSLTRIGCTSLVILVTKQHIYIANAGDCRATIGTHSGSIKQITKDHKPFQPEQQARITKAGGYVELGRVNGCLNLSRALGDLDFKNNKQIPLEEQAITSLPDTTRLDRKDIMFIFMCCDGVWECKTSEAIGEYVKKGIDDRMKLGKILQALFDEIVAKDSKDQHGTDNMSAILVKFDKPISVERYDYTKQVDRHKQYHYSSHHYRNDLYNYEQNENDKNGRHSFGYFDKYQKYNISDNKYDKFSKYEKEQKQDKQDKFKKYYAFTKNNKY